MEAQTAADRLLKLGKSVRMVTICDMNGKLIYHARHKSVANLVKNFSHQHEIDQII